MTVAVLAVAFGFAAVSGKLQYSPLVALIVAPHGIAGLVAYDVLRRRGPLTLLAAVFAGAVIGALPLALLTFSGPTSGSVNGVITDIDGHRT